MCKFILSITSALMGCLAFATASLNAQSGTASGWTPLFNGKDLDGWVQRGGKAKYTVENGAIVGTAIPGTPNSFICPPKNYSDFELQLEFKCDPDLNSGVQIRSQSKKLKDREQPFGYQVEIDMSAKNNRWWAAGIFDEGRRGWLFPKKSKDKNDIAHQKFFTDQGRKVSRQNEWNSLHIIASGDSIQTFLNGIPRASLKDGLTKSGFIGLQVHSVSKNGTGKQIRFRNLRIKEGTVTPASIPAPAADNQLTAAEKADGWKLLWNGVDSTGWRGIRSETFPAKGWEIKNGIISVLAADKGGDIITEKRYSSFELSADFKISPKANSGIKYFVQTGPKNTGIGHEFQVLDDLRHPDATRHNNTRTVGGLYDLIAPDPNKPLITPGGWHNARILVVGNKVTHYLDGFKTLEYDRFSDAFLALVKQSKFKDIEKFGQWEDGHILLQDHNDRVSYKNIKIREITK